PLTFHGVWHNWLRATRPEAPTTMSQVPPGLRRQAKARVADLCAAGFIGLRLRTWVTEDDRVTAWTERDHLFGYVAAGQELTAVRHAWWEILWATADDGNVNAIVRPASPPAAAGDS
ncbi:MAG: hypothetical protein ACRDHL_10395, partial [Candidatus Promineifilaceae bacterium]